MTNRIDPQLVVSAYRATGLRPVRAEFGKPGESACAMSALCVAGEQPHPETREQPWQYVETTLDIDPDYAHDFAGGFDAYPDRFGGTPGYADGAAAAALVFGTTGAE